MKRILLVLCMVVIVPFFMGATQVTPLSAVASASPPIIDFQEFVVDISGSATAARSRIHPITGASTAIGAAGGTINVADPHTRTASPHGHLINARPQVWNFGRLRFSSVNTDMVGDSTWHRYTVTVNITYRLHNAPTPHMPSFSAGFGSETLEVEHQFIIDLPIWEIPFDLVQWRYVHEDDINPNGTVAANARVFSYAIIESISVNVFWGVTGPSWNWPDVSQRATTARLR